MVAKGIVVFFFLCWSHCGQSLIRFYCQCAFELFWAPQTHSTQMNAFYNLMFRALLCAFETTMLHCCRVQAEYPCCTCFTMVEIDFLCFWLSCHVCPVQLAKSVFTAEPCFLFVLAILLLASHVSITLFVQTAVSLFFLKEIGARFSCNARPFSCRRCWLNAAPRVQHLVLKKS